MEDAEMAYSSSYSSSPHDEQSYGTLEIDLDRLPLYNGRRIASPAPSIASSPCLPNGLRSRTPSNFPASSSLCSNAGNTRLGSKLVGYLEKTLVDREWDYSDADIIVDDIPVGVIRFVLAASCPFFRELFKGQRSSGENRPRFNMSMLVPNGNVGYEAFLLLRNYLYTGIFNSYPHEVARCVDDSCSHEACLPAIEFQLQLLYASKAFQIGDLVALLQADLLAVVDKAVAEDVMLILVAAFHCKLNLLYDHCLKRVAQSDIRNLWIERELPTELQLMVVQLRIESKQDDAVAAMEYEAERRIRRILDTDDVEFVRLILQESAPILSESDCLHYAVTYCDPKVVSELLDPFVFEIRQGNFRGYTLLHTAARRMNPAIIESLLLKGARASYCTFDGLTAVSVCRRRTRMKDFHANTSENRLCIQILERDMLRNPTPAVVLTRSIDINSTPYLNCLNLLLKN